MVPLTLVALGWIVVFRAGRFHVGFPGQIVFGGMFVSIVALKVSLPPPIHLPLTILAGMLGGALYAAHRGVAVGEARRERDPLDAAAQPRRASRSSPGGCESRSTTQTTPLPLTPRLPEHARWPSLITNTQLHWDILLIPVAIAVVAFVLARTTFGFGLRLLGANRSVARHRRPLTGENRQAGDHPVRRARRARRNLARPRAARHRDGRGLRRGLRLHRHRRCTARPELTARRDSVGTAVRGTEQGGGVMEVTVGISSSLADFIQGLMIVLVLAATTMMFLLRRRSARRGRAGAGPAR